MKLLQSHDDNFDLCRTFLLISMIFTHAFEQFYIPDYNRNYTNYVTIGFVFLSGFTIGVLYFERVRNNPQQYFKRSVNRAFKLIMIYIIGNLVIIVPSQYKLHFLLSSGVLKNIVAIFLGTNTEFFAFDILIPIAITSFFAWFILRYLRKNVALLFIILFCLFLWFSETMNVLNYFGIKYSIAGFIGCFLGRLITDIEWDHTLKKLSRYYVTIICGLVIFIYYYIIVYFYKGLVKVHYHLIPTIIILLFVYLISYDFQLNKYRWFNSVNETLSRQLLFGYLFHLLLIHGLFFIFPKDSLDFFGTLLVALFLLSVCVITCFFLDFMTSKSLLLKKIYLNIFKV